VNAPNQPRPPLARAVAVCVLALAACAPAPPDQRIVLITFDTLRADGLTPRRMPHTHALAERGLRFERFYAASSATQPTHATLFTGRHPWQHGVARNGIPLSAEHETVAERFRSVGFQTAAVVASFALDRRFALDQGFEDYDQEFEHRLVRGQWVGADVEGQRFYGLADAVVARALERLDTLGGTRQFLWLHLFDPHEPYGDAAGGDLAYPAKIRALASAGELTGSHLQYARRLYHDDLRALDASLVPLYERLDSDAQTIETHIVLTSDHGESFGEDGSFTHGYRVSPEQVHVPFVVVSPKVSPELRRDAAGSRDAPRTLLALAGLDANGFPGRNLLEPPAGSGLDSDTNAEAHGMTGQFGTTPEMRTDGREIEASAPRFFSIVNGTLLTGDARHVCEDDREERLVVDERAEPLRARFAEFDRERRSQAATLLDDSATEDAMKALGYFE